jgi:hypothetical protein
MTLDKNGVHIPNTPTTDEPAPSTAPAGGGFVLGQDYTGGGPAVTPVGGGSSPSLAGISQQSISGEYWDPSKNQYITLRRLVPGMVDGTPSPLDYGNAQYVQPPQISIGDAMNNLLAMGDNADPDAIIALQDRLIKAGYLDPSKKAFNYGSITGTKDPTYSAYYNVLEAAIRTSTDYNAILTNRINRNAGAKFEKALDTVKARQAKADAALLPHTTTSTAVNLSDPLSAQALLTKTLSNELGRNPTTDEISQFTNALTTAQTQNPTTTSAYVDPTDPAAPVKSSTSTGGFDPNQFTENYVTQNFGQERDAVGAATGFYSAAMQALKPGGGF